MTHSPPKGLVVALITPFDEKGGIDWVSNRRLIERVLPFCDSLLIGEGLMGEGLSLPNPVRLDLLRGSLEAVSGKKPLLLCPTSSTPEETLDNIQALSKDFANSPGKDSLFWVDIPLWYHSNRKLPQLYQEWTKCTPFPILLYNIPLLIAKLNRSLKRSNIRTAVLKRLAENEQIVGLIQAGDLKRTIHYQRAVRARRDFRFYDGDEKNFLNGPSSSGVVSGGANILPREWSEIVTASLKISEDPARNLLLLKQSQKLRELSQALQKNPAMSLKFALHCLGLIPRARVLDETMAASSGEASEISHFLQANFSLQLRP
jgi:dihydrodipicolinate synthase/N-acetylneuraminate lyase